MEATTAGDGPLGRIKPEEFFATLASRWTGGCVLYLYRTWPVIDRKLVDPEAYLYIDKLGSAVTLDWLLKHWGSGEYKIRLNDEERPRGQNEVCWTTVKLSDPEFPPVLDVRELVQGHRDNRGYVEMLRQRGMLPKEGESVTDDSPAVQALSELARDAVRQRTAAPESAVQAKAMDMLQDAHRKSLEIVTANAKPVDPLELAARVKDLLGGGESMGLLLKVMMDQSQANQALLLKLLDARQAPALSNEDQVLERMERWMGLLGKLGFRRGGGEPSGFSFESVMNALPSISRLLELFVASRLAQQGVSPNLPAGAPVVPHGGAAPSAPPLSSEVPMFNPVVVEQIAARVADALDRMVSGDEFAHGLSAMLGADVYDSVAQLGVEGILTALRASPAAWARLSRYEAQLPQFVIEFVSYGQDGESGDDDGLRRAA